MKYVKSKKKKPKDETIYNEENRYKSLKRSENNIYITLVKFRPVSIFLLRTGYAPTYVI